MVKLAPSDLSSLCSIGIAIISAGCAQQSAGESLGSCSGQVFAGKVRANLGRVNAGSITVMPIRLWNPTCREVIVERYETTCHCIQPTEPRLVFSPRSGGQVVVRVDLSGEPNSMGGLLLGVKGWTDGGELAFDIEVAVDVIGTSETGPQGQRVGK